MKAIVVSKNEEKKLRISESSERETVMDKARKNSHPESASIG